MLLYAYRRYVVLCGALLSFALYALLLTAHGMPTPRFVLDPASAGVRPAGGFNLRRVSDLLAGRKYAVLTFDDAPYGYGLDEEIIATLRKHHAHAVFFVACRHLDPGDGALLKELSREGDLIGGAGDGRPGAGGAAAIAHRIESCNERLAALTGTHPYYFHASSGATAPQVLQALRSLGMKPMAWNVEADGGSAANPRQALAPSAAQMDDQSILLLHDTPATAGALDDMLAQLEQRGFQFVLPDQLGADGQQRP